MQLPPAVRLEANQAIVNVIHEGSGLCPTAGNHYDINRAEAAVEFVVSEAAPTRGPLRIGEPEHDEWLDRFISELLDFLQGAIETRVFLNVHHAIRDYRDMRIFSAQEVDDRLLGQLRVYGVSQRSLTI